MPFTSLTDKAAVAISQMIGGGPKSIQPQGGNLNFVTFFFLTIFILLIRSLIVFWGYNALMPKFIITLSNDPNNIKNYRELTYGEAILLVIAIQCLVN